MGPLNFKPIPMRLDLPLTTFDSGMEAHSIAGDVSAVMTSPFTAVGPTTVDASDDSANKYSVDPALLISGFRTANVKATF